LLPDGPTVALSQIPHDLMRIATAPNPPHGADASACLPAAEASPSHAQDAQSRQLHASTAPQHVMPDPDAIAAAFEVRMDHLMTRRLEALEQRLGGSLPSEESSQLRSDAFWRGMEQTLRLLHGLATRLDESAAALEPRYAAVGDPAEMSAGGDHRGAWGSLGQLEEVVALGFEAADASRDINHSAIATRLGAMEARLHVMADPSDALDRLNTRLAELEESALRRDSLGAATVQALDVVGDAISGLDRRLADLSERLRASDGGMELRVESLAAGIGERFDAMEAAHADGVAGLDASQDKRQSAADMLTQRKLDEIDSALRTRTADLKEHVTGRLGDLSDRLADPLERLGPALLQLSGSMPEPQAMAEPVLDRIETLTERLADRGGVLSDGVDTAQRSMKKFWLAAEDVLRRIDESVSRLDRDSGDDATRKTAATQRVESLERQIRAMEDRQKEIEDGNAQLRHALAELLAGQARAAAERRREA